MFLLVWYLAASKDQISYELRKRRGAEGKLTAVQPTFNSTEYKNVDCFDSAVLD